MLSRKPRYEASQVWMEDRTQPASTTPLPGFVGKIDHARAVVPRLSFPRPQESLGTRLSLAIAVFDRDLKSWSCTK